MFSRRPEFRFNRGRIVAATAAEEEADVEDILTTTAGLGGTLLVDFYTPASYTLAGDTLTAVNNRITDTALTVNGTPQYGATGLNSGPTVALNGTTDYLFGSEAAVYNIWQDNGVSTLIVVSQADVADASGTMFSVGNSGSTVSYRYVGQWDNASGKMRSLAANDAAAASSVIGDDGTSVATASVWEVTSNGTTLTVRRNRVLVGGMSAQPFAPGTLTPNQYAIGAWARSTFSLFFNGNISLVAGFPSELDSGELDTLYASLAAHDAAIAGLLP